jgi:CheY-like chemotaxis protein
LQILKNYLESFTCDVAVASNGQDALNAVRGANEEGRPFDLAILDWKMPQMDGIELAQKLRGMDDLRVRPKILLISAYSQDEILLQMDNQMVDGILAKPFQLSKLFDAVAKVSGRDKSATGKFRIGTQFNSELLSQIRGARLLLVEDDEINQQVARELLESYGIKVVVAENGEEAIALLGEEQFDCVLMDIQMPVMDGVSATREIRKNPQFSKLPIIALTANVMVSEQNEFLSAGMNDHIGKPIDPDQLVAKLVKWVRPTRTTGSTPVGQTFQNSAPEPLPDLPGVKVAESLRRIGGSVTLYFSLLDKFRVNQRNFATSFREALAADDRSTAERLAHTLRGIAGTLGAETLQDLAKLLESSIKKEESGEVDSLLARVDKELATFIASIDQVLETRRD